MALKSKLEPEKDRQNIFKCGVQIYWKAALVFFLPPPSLQCTYTARRSSAVSPFHLAELVCISVDVQVGQRAETDHLPSASPLRHARSDFTSQSLANASHRRGYY